MSDNSPTAGQDTAANLTDANKKIRNATLLFLIKRSESGISDICLAMKKRGFGANRYNGVGGKVEPGESVLEAAKREALEEIGIHAKDTDKIAEFTFLFANNPAWNQLVHVYFCENWENDPVESDEMRPAWFNVGDIPFDQMWPDDIFWMPEVIAGKKVRATFTFGDGDAILDQALSIVEGF